jgi:hypothetical protein
MIPGLFAIPGAAERFMATGLSARSAYVFFALLLRNAAQALRVQRHPAVKKVSIFSLE